MKLLLISNSTNAGEPYLKYPMPRIDEFLGSVREVVFVPYAGITFSYAEYEAKVQARFAEYGIKVRSVHRSKDPRRMIRERQHGLRSKWRSLTPTSARPCGQQIFNA